LGSLLQVMLRRISWTHKRLLRFVPNLAKTIRSVITSRRRSNSEGFGKANLLKHYIFLTLPNFIIIKKKFTFGMYLRINVVL
jgi:hypothetical protein